MQRSLAVASWAVAISLTSLASAQTPPPPSGYAAASITPDLVLEPLLAAAEADLGRGEAALALARATAVTAAVPPDSATHVRAEGLVLLATQRLAGAPATTVAADVALAPLVDTAALDGPAGRGTLARARLEFVLGRIAGTSALATRATALRAALDAQAAAPPPTVATTTAVAPQYQPIYGGAAPTYVYTAPDGPDSPQSHLARGQTTDDPHRRGDAEIVELYITGGLFGGYIGAWIPYGSGLFNGAAADDRARLTTAAVLIGSGVSVLGIFGLDQIDRGLRTGVPAGIGMGIRYGLGLGGLMLGIVGARTSGTTEAAFNVMGFSGLAGGLLGAVLTMTLEPHPSQVQFTQTSGLWGVLFGAQLAMLIAPLIRADRVTTPFGGTFDSGQTRQEVGFGLTFAGLGAGVLTGMIFSAAHINPSARRSWHLTLGFLAGTGGGTLLWSLISALSGTLDVPTLGGCQFVGAIGGLVISGLLSSGDRERANWDEDPAAAAPTFQVSISPTQGGGVIGVNGAF